MTLLLAILFGFLACFTGGLYLFGVFRQQQPGEPPLDKGLIPWLGHILEYRKDTVKFLKRMKQKHGDVFTVQLGGNYITFMQDPLSLGAFVKESRKTLDFNAFARNLVHRVFGYKSMGNEHPILMSTSQKHLSGAGLEVLTQAMMCNLQNIMMQKFDKDADQREWMEDELFMYSYSVLFRAGYLSLFGNASPMSEGSVEKAKEKDKAESKALFHEFCKYDHLFPNLAYGLLPRREKMEAEKIKEFFWKALSMQKLKTKDNISGWVSDMQRAREEMGIKESMIDRYMLVLLWVSQGNTGPSAFWLLFFLMKHPEAMTAVKGEIDKVLKESGQEVVHGGPLINLTCDMLKKTPILDSAVEETLRLISAPILIRSVVQNMTLKMADGCEYHIRKGDKMAVFPHSAVHTDPEIHPNPDSFKYDRFLNPDGSKKTDFYKAGKRVKYYNMPFGAGVSMCPGRFFANNELKQFIFLMLVYFEFELKNPHEKIPDPVIDRSGFGALHPISDIQFRYRFRF
ncbi:7-alpha-hydroxycholest-4-en-3-one 12-alpha-hydroxylase-like [Xiphias gladius]|uniref:7-alpha-hydroxycholest-4-en-3-one 12-alpha-hydroxylase-like n=1 Tax=Xiphias gladius TaxID=8245 RepID=UPI001A99A892|nr:7-alpha-hydroxycholest-4-en-3-one 12-alpha-hydroxylase-like [Xiphias gladius]